MITAKFERKTPLGTEWEDITDMTLSPVNVQLRQDREFDTGAISYRSYADDSADTEMPPLSMYRLTLSDSTGSVVYPFCGVESKAKVRNAQSNGLQALYSHSVSLIEGSKLLQGVLLDGFGVAQPETEADRTTLFEEVTRLLETTPTTLESGQQLFTLTDDTEIVALLQGTKAPQFRWSNQTTFWEALSDVGAVIDCIPQLALNKEESGIYPVGTVFNVVTFVPVNSVGNVYDSLQDEYTNAIGDSTDIQQYNSNLVAVLENLVEK